MNATAPPAAPPAPVEAAPASTYGNETLPGELSIETVIGLSVGISCCGCLTLCAIVLLLWRLRRRRPDDAPVERTPSRTRTASVVPVAQAPANPQAVTARPSHPAEKARAEALERERLAVLRGLPTYWWVGNGGRAGRTVGWGGPQRCQHCVLCMEGFEDGVSIRRLPCGHYYHTECIDQWLIVAQASQRRSCPLCKADPVAPAHRHAPTSAAWSLDPVTEVSPPPRSATPRSPLSSSESADSTADPAHTPPADSTSSQSSQSSQSSPPTADDISEAAMTPTSASPVAPTPHRLLRATPRGHHRSNLFLSSPSPIGGIGAAERQRVPPPDGAGPAGSSPVAESLERLVAIASSPMAMLSPRALLRGARQRAVVAPEDPAAPAEPDGDAEPDAESGGADSLALDP